MCRIYLYRIYKYMIYYIYYIYKLYNNQNLTNQYKKLVATSNRPKLYLLFKMIEMHQDI